MASLDDSFNQAEGSIADENGSQQPPDPAPPNSSGLIEEDWIIGKMAFSYQEQISPQMSMVSEARGTGGSLLVQQTVLEFINTLIFI